MAILLCSGAFVLGSPCTPPVADIPRTINPRLPAQGARGGPPALDLRQLLADPPRDQGLDLRVRPSPHMGTVSLCEWCELGWWGPACGWLLPGPRTAACPGGRGQPALEGGLGLCEPCSPWLPWRPLPTSVPDQSSEGGLECACGVQGWPRWGPAEVQGGQSEEEQGAHCLLETLCTTTFVFQAVNPDLTGLHRIPCPRPSARPSF